MAKGYDIESLEYLRELSQLPDMQDDPACLCCAWAVREIERLDAKVRNLKIACSMLEVEREEIRDRLCCPPDCDLLTWARMMGDFWANYGGQE